MPKSARVKLKDELVEKFNLRVTSWYGPHLWAVSETNVIWFFTLRWIGNQWKAFPVPEEAHPPCYACPLKWINDKKIPVTNQGWRDQVRQHMKDLKQGALATLKSGEIVIVTAENPPYKAWGANQSQPIAREDVDSLVYAGNWMEVTSSNLDAIRYQDKKKTLDIRFKNGTTYRYEKVTRDAVVELLNAQSIGSAFHRIIRSGPFEYEKL